jgi:flavin reductase
VTALSAAARVMASFVTGVTVITTQVRGEIRGMTANAFMSGSLEPPLCVVSVGKKARMHTFLLESGHFGVNILARGQEALIGHFAGRPVEGFDPKYEYAGDTPLFAHAISSIAAKVTARHECGDHSLFIGHIFARIFRLLDRAGPRFIPRVRKNLPEVVNWPGSSRIRCSADRRGRPAGSGSVKRSKPWLPTASPLR